MPRILGLSLALLIAIALPLVAVAEEQPVLVVAPQVWFSHIPTVGTTESGSSLTPKRFFIPQWGGTLGLRLGQWTYGLSVLSSDYEIEEVFTPKAQPYTCSAGTCRGDITNEYDFSRIDTDFIVSYAFLDVIKDKLDVSLGGGIKWVRIAGEIDRVDPAGAVFSTGRTRETFDENIVGPTLPVGVNYHITNRLFLPVTAIPYLAWDSYSDTFGRDTTKLTYGGTGDVGLRYVFSNGVAVDGGYRGQFLFGGPLGSYGAHGPYVRMSVPFGLGK